MKMVSRCRNVKSTTISATIVRGSYLAFIFSHISLAHDGSMIAILNGRSEVKRCRGPVKARLLNTSSLGRCCLLLQCLRVNVRVGHDPMDSCLS